MIFQPQQFTFLMSQSVDLLPAPGGRVLQLGKPKLCPVTKPGCRCTCCVLRSLGRGQAVGEGMILRRTDPRLPVHRRPEPGCGGPVPCAAPAAPLGLRRDRAPAAARGRGQQRPSAAPVGGAPGTTAGRARGRWPWPRRAVSLTAAALSSSEARRVEPARVLPWPRSSVTRWAPGSRSLLRPAPGACLQGPRVGRKEKYTGKFCHLCE